MEDIFGSGGVLAHHLAGYEPRPGQQQMAEAVAESCGDPDRPGCLVVEAETGLGKTLAYLVPAVLSGRRVVVSTNTSNLQDQILQREIPFIRQYIDPSLQGPLRQGQAELSLPVSLAPVPGGRAGRSCSMNETVTGIERLAQRKREFGDRSELKWLTGGSPLWQKICCLPHFCLGGDCPDSSACFLNRLRREAAQEFPAGGQPSPAFFRPGRAPLRLW